MLTRRIPLLLISLLLLAFITAGITSHATIPIVSAGANIEPQSKRQSALEERIKRVENGLLQPFAIKGQPSVQMKLVDRMKYYNTPGISIAVTSLSCFRNRRRSFFPLTTAVEITFVKDEKGQVTHLILRQGGQDIKAKKIN